MSETQTPHTPNDPNRQTTRNAVDLFDWDAMRTSSLNDIAQHNRDVGIGKISDNNAKWMEVCLDLFPYYYQDTFTGEDIRRFYECRHLVPSHHNAWGALTSQLIKKGLIRATGERRHMKDPQSHARLTDVYVKL